MRNNGLAILQYVNTKNSFPPAGVFGENPQSLNPADPTTSVITNYLKGTATNPLYAPMYSWVVPILPYLDSQELYNQWSMYSNSGGNQYTVGYLDGQTGGAGTGNTVANLSIGQASNYKIGSTAIGVLRCPDDVSAQPNQGNLSYAVNGGFVLWHGTAVPYGWASAQTDAGSMGPVGIGWAGSSNTNTALTWGICQKLGVFFIESALPEGYTVRIPWNIRSTLNSMVDGASSTIMLSENTLTGVNTGNALLVEPRDQLGRADAELQHVHRLVERLLDLGPDRGRRQPGLHGRHDAAPAERRQRRPRLVVCQQGRDLRQHQLRPEPDARRLVPVHQ